VNFDNFELIEFLNARKDAINILRDVYHVLIKEKDDLILLKYHQIDTPKCHLTNQCRGVIVTKIDDVYQYVCRGFYRFFNAGESSATPHMDRESSKAQEKIDGSLIKFYYWNDNWRIATNGNINAADSNLPTIFYTPAYGEVKTFADLVVYYLQSNDILYKTLQSFCERKTYLFELTSPYNRVVVPHKEIQLTFLSSIDNVTGEESLYNPTTLPSVKEYSFQSMDDCIHMAQNLPYDSEGYVFIDKFFNRIKIKSPAYLAVHHLRGESVPTVKSMLGLIGQGEQDEFLSYFPEYRDLYNKVNFAVVAYSEIAESLYNSCKVERKDIARIYGKYSGYIFSRMDNRVDSAREYLFKMHIKNQVELIEGIIHGGSK
jgi:hypothetical protein